MRNSSALKITSSIIVLWLASLACNTIYHAPLPDTPTPTSAPTIQISPKDGMEIVFVEAGTFIMGSDNDEVNESPKHEIYIDDYWIDKTEVTNKMYYSCIKSGGCEKPLSDGFIAPTDHYTNPAKENYPVVYVNYENAESYCQWASRRLPTEAEWEKAARGVDGRIYPWGNQSPTQDTLNFNQNIGDLMPVGSYPLGASPYGALDMSGNALEWVADWYSDNYYEQSPSSNPIGPDSGQFRVSRGGGFYQSEYEVRATMRYSAAYWYNQSGDFSFRCAADAVHTPTTTSSR